MKVITKKEEKKDTVKTDKKVEKLELELGDIEDRIIKLTRFSGRLGDHYLTQDGKKLYYITRLEKSSDLCVLDLEDGSIKVLIKGVSGSIVPGKGDKNFYMLSRGGISKIAAASGKKETISFSGELREN